MDTIIEKRIFNNLKQRNCSLIIISHRLNIIRDCDEIIVLEKGKLAQRGTHDELVKQSGVYQHLFNLDSTDSIE
jgi:ABC-type bacteriocin/lantibiotic exporter with double-glycine peptidase domain